MRKTSYYLFTLFTIMGTITAFAQEQQRNLEKAEMAVGMRANGKIYVVVAVVVTILAGVILYLVSIDRKLRKLEKQQSG